MKILPLNEVGPHRTGSINPDYTVGDINRILGFAPNVQDEIGRAHV